MSTDVFISYRRSDRPCAEMLEKSLSRLGVSAWYDGMIGPGADWRANIVENIKLARVLVILFSEEANESTELVKELSVADESQTLIVPVRVEDVAPRGTYEYELAARNWFDAFENPPAQLDEVAGKIAEALRVPADLRRHLAKSAAALDSRRWRQLYGRRGLAANNTFLAIVFLIVTTLQFFAYESSVKAVARMVEGQTPRIVALGVVAFAVSVGSPLLLIQAVRQPLSSVGWLIVPCSLTNSVAMVLFVRNAFASIRFRRTRRAA
jgi:hypothetical protein